MSVKITDNSRHPNPAIRAAWQRGLDVLQPTSSQLQHGLELHANLLPCDNFGFMPSIWTEESASIWKELQEGEVGARDLHLLSGLARTTAPTRDREAARQFIEAFDATGLRCMMLTVAEGKSREQDIKRMAAYIQVLRVFRKRLAQAGSVDEVREAAQSGRTAVIWSVNGPPLVGHLNDPDEELGWIQPWYNLGVRLMHLTYNRRNFIGDGCAEPANAGLSELGRELIKRMNEVGIIVDVPHSGDRTTIEAARASSKPMTASHTGAKGVFDHMRCKSDAAIKAIADTGGLLGVYVLPNMLGPKATLNTMLDHVDYIAKLAGVDHVAIGTDTTYATPFPPGIARRKNARFSAQWWGNWKPDNHPLPPSDEASAGSLAWTNWPLYTVGLVMRGYSDADVAKVLGENLMRVLEANRAEGCECVGL